MHLFLTGYIQVGKSTALRRFLKDSGISADGFLTEFDSRGAVRRLYLKRFDTEARRDYNDMRLVAEVGPGGMRPYPEAFDTFGVDCIASAGKRRVILMDELGLIEEDSPLFKEAVLRRLDGGIPVVGVVKMRESPFLDAVRAHPDVEAITVTLENRDGIPALLAERAGRCRVV